jgi:integrase/recombinase XerD
MVLLSVRAGMRAKEIARATWSMCLDADGEVGEAIELHDKASKGKNGGREIPLHPDLRAALVALAGGNKPTAPLGSFVASWMAPWHLIALVCSSLACTQD